MSEAGSFLIPREKSFLNYRNINPSVIKRFNFSNTSSVSCKETLKVYLRVKPLSGNNLCDEKNFIVKDNKSICTYSLPPNGVHKGKPQVSNYSFTRVFEPETDQSEVFNAAVSDSCANFISGNNCLLFSYGATSSGKTFTIQGSGSNPGIIPRALVMLFRTIDDKMDNSHELYPDQVQSVTLLSKTALAKVIENKSKLFTIFEQKSYNVCKGSKTTITSINDSLGDITYQEMEERLANMFIAKIEDDVLCSVWVSFFEIYNEVIYDLLDSNMNRRALPLAYDSDKNIYIKGLQFVNVLSGSEAYKVFMFGKNNLHISSTLLNKCSSRSHSIFTIKLLKRYPDKSVSVSSFSFCDLAGTERQKKAQNEAGRLKECQNINTSHLVLNRCFKIIRENQKRKEKQMVPFRDSKLTQVFQRALMGQEEMIMIVNISQYTGLLHETLQVLKSSAIACEIEVQRSQPRHYSRRKSRFLSSYDTRNKFSIHWKPSQESQSEVLNKKSSDSIHSTSNETQAIQDLTVLVESLRSQLENEKAERAINEEKIRTKLCTGFKEIIAEMETEHKQQLAAAYTEESTDIFRTLGKRRRTEVELDDSVVMDMKVNYMEQINELELELSAAKEKVLELTDCNKYLQKKTVSLECQLAVYQSKESSSRVHFEKIVQELEDKSVKTVIEDLRKQIEGNKTKIQDLEDLLEIGHDEIEGLMKNIYNMECQIEQKNTLLQNKDCEIENLKLEIYDLEQVITVKDNIISNMECNLNKDSDGEILNKNLDSLKLEEEEERHVLIPNRKSNFSRNSVQSNQTNSLDKVFRDDIFPQKTSDKLQSEQKGSDKDIETEPSDKSVLLELNSRLCSLETEKQLLIEQLKKAESDMVLMKNEMTEKYKTEVHILKDKNKSLIEKVKTLESNIKWMEDECKGKGSKNEYSSSDINTDDDDDDDDSDSDVTSKIKLASSVRKRGPKKKEENNLPLYHFRSLKSESTKLEKTSNQSRKTGRKLFTKDCGDEPLLDVRTIETVQSSPGSFVKRVLRSHKK